MLGLFEEQIIVTHKKKPNIEYGIKATTSRIPKGLMGHDAPKKRIKQIY
jgi:hypothetical protein